MPATEPAYRKPPIPWTVATAVELVEETRQVRTLRLDVSGWPGHLPGQHLDVRLTAEDGYQQERSYSIASSPDLEHVEITVERIDDGAVSPYLAGDLQVGDQFEVRGPIGGYFVWNVDHTGPVLLIGGGSGVVPLMAMLRHRQLRQSAAEMTLLVSARSHEQLIYADELRRVTGQPNLHIAVTLTRSAPRGWDGYERRIDDAMIRDLLPTDRAGLQGFLCGPNAFVENSSQILVRQGLPVTQVHTERFGPTGT
jgi:ferredoxin-NADP reductase